MRALLLLAWWTTVRATLPLFDYRPFEAVSPAPQAPIAHALLRGLVTKFAARLTQAQVKQAAAVLSGSVCVLDAEPAVLDAVTKLIESERLESGVFGLPLRHARLPPIKLSPAFEPASSRAFAAADRPLRFEARAELVRWKRGRSAGVAFLEGPRRRRRRSMARGGRDDERFRDASRLVPDPDERAAAIRALRVRRRRRRTRALCRRGAVMSASSTDALAAVAFYAMRSKRNESHQLSGCGGRSGHGRDEFQMSATRRQHDERDASNGPQSARTLQGLRGRHALRRCGGVHYVRRPRRGEVFVFSGPVAAAYSRDDPTSVGGDSGRGV